MCSPPQGKQTISNIKYIHLYTCALTHRFLHSLIPGVYLFTPPIKCTHTFLSSISCPSLNLIPRFSWSTSNSTPPILNHLLPLPPKSFSLGHTRHISLFVSWNKMERHRTKWKEGEVGSLNREDKCHFQGCNRSVRNVNAHARKWAKGKLWLGRGVKGQVYLFTVS